MPFMIRNGAGLYSSGGRSPRFKEEGKMWRTIGQVKNHLSLFRDVFGVNGVPADWEVVEIQIQMVPHTTNARELAQIGADKAAEEMKNYRSKYEKENAERELRELKRLKEKYE